MPRSKHWRRMSSLLKTLTHQFLPDSPLRLVPDPPRAAEVCAGAGLVRTAELVADQYRDALAPGDMMRLLPSQTLQQLTPLLRLPQALGASLIHHHHHRLTETIPDLRLSSLPFPRPYRLIRKRRRKMITMMMTPRVSGLSRRWNTKECVTVTTASRCLLTCRSFRPMPS